MERAKHLLTVLGEKLAAAAKPDVLGRCTKKAVAVDEAEAQLEQCDESQEVLQAELTRRRTLCPRAAKTKPAAYLCA